jgi:hypothetical protein
MRVIDIGVGYNLEKSDKQFKPPYSQGSSILTVSCNENGSIGAVSASTCHINTTPSIPATCAGIGLRSVTKCLDIVPLAIHVSLDTYHLPLGVCLRNGSRSTFISTERPIT